MAKQVRRKRNARVSNWQCLPSRQESIEELTGDYQELKSQGGTKQRGVVKYIHRILQRLDWSLAQLKTEIESTHLKFKDDATLDRETDNKRAEYVELLLQKARVSFYGAFGAGILGLSLIGMACFGNSDMAITTVVGGLSFKAAAYFAYKVSQDANDRLDRYFNNGKSEDENGSENKDRDEEEDDT